MGHDNAGSVGGGVELRQHSQKGSPFGQRAFRGYAVNALCVLRNREAVWLNEGGHRLHVPVGPVIEQPRNLHNTRPVPKVADWRSPTLRKPSRFAVEEQVHGIPQPSSRAAEASLPAQRSWKALPAGISPYALGHPADQGPLTPYPSPLPLSPRG